MKPDPIVDEVRKACEEHAAKLGYDLSAICADLRGKEERWSSRGFPTTQTPVEDAQKLTSPPRRAVPLSARLRAKGAHP